MNSDWSKESQHFQGEYLNYASILSQVCLVPWKGMKTPHFCSIDCLKNSSWFWRNLPWKCRLSLDQSESFNGFKADYLQNHQKSHIHCMDRKCSILCTGQKSSQTFTCQKCTLSSKIPSKIFVHAYSLFI